MDSTPEMNQSQQEALMQAISQQAQQINDESSSGVEVGEQPATANPKSVSVSKGIINASFIIFGLIGIAGCFDVLNFDMDKYVKFISAFAYIWAPLVIAVGAGRAVKNYSNQKYGSSTTPTTPAGK